MEDVLLLLPESGFNSVSALIAAFRTSLQNYFSKLFTHTFRFSNADQVQANENVHSEDPNM
jgi:hypothetical protein